VAMLGLRDLLGQWDEIPNFSFIKCIELSMSINTYEKMAMHYF